MNWDTRGATDDGRSKEDRLVVVTSVGGFRELQHTRGHVDNYGCKMACVVQPS